MLRLHLTAPLLALLIASTPATAQLKVLEPGFKVCKLPDGVGAKQVECSPGGVWGNYVYVADSSAGLVERIDPLDNVTPFSTVAVGSFPVGLEFGPGPGGTFGTRLYVSNFGTSQIGTLGPAGGVIATFASVSSPGGVRFDPSGAYGSDLFVATNAFGGPIVTLPPAGAPATFFSIESATYMKFGPGGAFGTGMYSTSQGSSPGIVKIDAAGSSTPFSSGMANPEGFDWASGPGFGGDLFSTDVSAGTISRIDPTGLRTTFALLPSAADVAYCNGSLYAVSLAGECYRISWDTGPVTYCTAGTSASLCNAAISTSGAPSATAPAGFTVSASNVEGDKDGLFFFGTNGRQANPWGSGTSFQCVRPPVIRGGLLTGTGTNGLCDGSLSQDLNALWCPVCPKPLKNPGAGACVQGQFWYRDPFNTSNQTTGLSNAIEFLVGP